MGEKGKDLKYLIFCKVLILTCAKCIYKKLIAFRFFMQVRFSQINDTQPDSSTFLSMKVFDLLVIYE